MLLAFLFIMLFLSPSSSFLFFCFNFDDFKASDKGVRSMMLLNTCAVIDRMSLSDIILIKN